MSIKLKDVDLSTVQTNFNVDTMGKAITDCAWIEFVNDSPFTCDVNAGGLNVPVIAWERHPIQLQVKNGPVWQEYQGAAFPITVTPRLLSPVDLTQYATTLLTTLYLTGEQPTSIVPSQFTRQPKVVNASVSTVNNVSNIGNSPGTSVVFGQPGGDTGTALQVYNNGEIDLGDSKYPGIFKAIDTGGQATFIEGTLIVMGNNLFRVDGPGNVKIAGTSSLDNGLITTNGSGLLTLVKLALALGSLSKIAPFGPYTLNITPALQNHNLGVVPDLILLVCVNGGGGVNGAPGYNDGTMTTTQASMFSTANGTFARGLAIKF